MNAEILTIGDELLIGQVINSNQAYIAERLNMAGVSIARMTTVGDDLEAILNAYAGAWKRSTFVIVTGGLGPTHDDITKKAVCKFFNTDLVPDAGVRRTIEMLMKKRNLPWTPAAEEQTFMPRNATVIPNPVGTAAGMLFEEHGKYLFVLPGVPYEMKEMLEASVIPFVASKVTGSAIRHLTLRTTGIPESFLAQQLGNLDEVLEGAQLAFLPSPRGVRLRITVKDADGTSAEARVRGVEQRIRRKVQKYIYASGDVELEEVLGKILAEKKLTIAVAESCTGGLIASRLTDVSGSSKYFERGVVTYSDRSKTELLNVPAHMIQQHGAVSKEVAEAMADGIRMTARADIGLSTTGIAGPTGGSEEKPVGLVWIGYADAKDIFALKFNLGDGRTRIKERAAQAALELVRRRILRVD